MQERSERITLSAQFTAWAEEREYSVYYYPDEDQVSVASHPGGEYQFRVTRRDGVLLVKPVVRSQGGDVVFRAPDIIDVERFLTAEIADEH